MLFIIILQSILNIVLFFIVYRQSKNNINPELSSVFKDKQKELDDSKNQYYQLLGESNLLKDKIKEKEERATDLEKIIENKDNIIVNLKSKNSFLESDNENLKQEKLKKIELENELKKLEIDNKKIAVELAEKKKNIENLIQLQNQIKNEFKVISNEIIKEQKDTFNKEQTESLGHILLPLNKDIKEFKDKIQQVQDGNNANTIKIEENIKNLLNTTIDIGNKADNLATALKGDKKAQGNWGELQLRNLLELSGLEKDISFFEQYNIKDSDGKNFFLDFLIKLPEDRILIVDSKISLVNYDNYIRSNNENEKNNYLKLYCEDIKNHIKELGAKEYQNVYKEYNKKSAKDVPDFVFMFIAIESAFIDAIKFDKSIFDVATKNKVAITTTSSFMPVLRMIEHLWNIENQNKYIGDIVDLSQKLCDKIRKFSEEIIKIGVNIDKTKEAYDNMKNYLAIGKGNMLSTASKIINIADKKNIHKPLMLDFDDDIKDENNN